MFLAFAVYMVPGIFGATYGPNLEGILPLPPKDGGIKLAFAGGEGKQRDVHELAWLKDDLEGGLKASKENGRPVFIDFTGYN
jgi:hypothetical protein